MTSTSVENNELASNDVEQQTAAESSGSEFNDSLLRDIKNLPPEGDAFEDTLVWPRIDDKKPGTSRKKKEHVPAVASSERWRKWYKDKEAIKTQKQEEVRLRQEERLKAQAEKQEAVRLRKEEREKAKLKRETEKALKQQEKAEKREAKKKVLRA